MTDVEYKTKLAAGLRGCFLFFGDEDYLRRHYLTETRRRTVGDGDAFNHTILRGAEEVGRLADAVAQPPMLSDVRLIELHEVVYSALSADDISALLDAGREAAAQGDTVLLLVTDPSEFDTGSLPKRPSALYKQLTEVFNPVDFSRVTAGKLAAWAGRHFARDLIIAEPGQLDLLVSRCGSAMSTLSGEIEKLCAYLHAHGRDRLTDDDILLVTCRGAETDAFALSNAVLARKIGDAFAALYEMKVRHTEPVIALSGITRVCCDLAAVSSYAALGLPAAEIASRLKMHAYKAGLYIDAAGRWGEARLHRAVVLCADADEAVKSTRQGYLALERLLSALLG